MVKGDSKYWQEVDDEDSVFLLPKKENTTLYNYIHNTLRNLNDDTDWRMTVDGVKQLNLGLYRVAMVAKNQNKATEEISRYMNTDLDVDDSDLLGFK